MIFYILGALVIKFSNLPDPFTGGRFIYSNAIGLAIVSLIYPVWRVLEIGQEYLYLLFFFTFVVWLVTVEFKNSSKKATSLIRSDYMSLGVLVTIILAMLNFTHFSDAVLTANGFNLKSSSFTESLFHQGLINSLVDSYPPQPLYASGITDFSYYHLGMHLHIELIYRLFGIGTVKLVYYYFAFFYLFFTINTKLFFCTVYRWELA